jgi:hypothetical protein
MSEKYGADCPCGFTMTTPHGMDDAIAIVQTHVMRVHPDMPNTREAAKAVVRKR